MSHSAAVLRTRGLHKAWGSLVVTDNVFFDLAPGARQAERPVDTWAAKVRVDQEHSATELRYHDGKADRDGRLALLRVGAGHEQ